MRPIHKALLAIVALGIVLVVALLLYRRMGPLPTLTDRDIAGATAITSQWLEIKPDPVLKPSSKTPLVILELEGDYAPDFDSQRLRYPDGMLGAPELLPEDMRPKEIAPRRRLPLDEIAFTGEWGTPAF